MRILTSSWFTPLPDDHLRIGTSRASPRDIGSGYRTLRALAPGPWFRSCPTPEKYRERYFDEVLRHLDPARTVAKVSAIADGRTPVLVCFEPPDAVATGRGWCHRALISAWLFDALQLEVRELGMEDAGFGWRHPLLHPSLRRA